VAGGDVVGFYWRGDYVDASDAHVSADGRVLTFTFAGGRAMLTRAGAETATIVVTDAKGAASIDLRRG
jgi:hypothetical protein